MGTQFFAPLLLGVSSLPSFRVCPDLSDPDCLLFGVLRSLEWGSSGRAFLQRNGSLLPGCPEISQFFEALKSPRRLAFCSEAADALRTRLMSLLPDSLSQFPALSDFDVWAGDGHFHAAAAHDPRDEKGRKHATGHLFMLDLSRHVMAHLCVGDQDGRLKEHDMRGLKRSELKSLRMGAAKGRKVIIVWDRAGIDFRQWYHWKTTGGLYFISREKENMTLEVCGQSGWDRADPLNAGVVADELCMPSSAGVTIRRVRFVRPDTGEEIAFITTEMTLPPGLIAELYRRRWDIESSGARKPAESSPKGSAGGQCRRAVPEGTGKKRSTSSKTSLVKRRHGQPAQPPKRCRRSSCASRTISCSTTNWPKNTA